MSKKPKIVKFSRLSALEGDTERFLEQNDKPYCARCENTKKMKRVFTFVRFGMFEDTCTPVFSCPQCLENTCFTYTVEHEIGEVVE